MTLERISSEHWNEPQEDLVLKYLLRKLAPPPAAPEAPRQPTPPADGGDAE